MQCYRPVTIRNPHADLIGQPSTFDVPCRRCPACQQNDLEDWTLRLMEEYRNSLFGVFLTLTYNEEHLPYYCYFPNSNTDGVYTLKELGNAINVIIADPTVYKYDVQCFFKRLRRNFPQRSFRYYAIAEYGGKTDRPHYHILLFSDFPFIDVDFESLWSNGNIMLGNVTFNSIKYCAKHHLRPKQYNLDVDALPTFRLMSKGIGRSYLTDDVLDFMANNDLPFIYQQGYKHRIPKYYKDKFKMVGWCPPLPDITDSQWQRLVSQYPDMDFKTLSQMYEDIIQQKQKKQLQKSKCKIK